MAYACTFTTDPDVELWLTYRSDNTPAGTALQVVPRHYDWNNNIALQIFNNQMRLALSQGGTTTYVSNTSAASASGTWYELHIKCSGSTTTVWRRPAGSNALFEQVLTTSSAPTTGSTMVRLHFGTSCCFSVDNVRLVADAKSTTTRFSYSNANELLYEYIGSITKSYDYDSYGRLVTKTMPGHVAAYAYGYKDKMKTMTSNLPDEATSESFIYDGLDKLRRVTTPAGMTWMRSGRGLNFEALYTGGSDPNTTWDIGTVKAKFINDPRQQAGLPLAMRFPVAGNPDRYAYTMTDNILSVRSLRLDDRTLAGAYEYTPYGAAYTASGPTDYYQFAGLYHDTATDQYWTPNRWYDPEIARWTTPDPLGLVDGPNVYAYVGGRLVIHIDIKGLACASGWNEPLVPDRYPWMDIDFTSACTTHDNCYGCDGEGQGKNRAQCDSDFLNNSNRECDRHQHIPETYSTCVMLAKLYYYAVRYWGKSAFDNGRACCDGNGNQLPKPPIINKWPQDVFVF